MEVKTSPCHAATLICDFDGSNVRCKECDLPVDEMFLPPDSVDDYDANGYTPHQQGN